MTKLRSLPMVWKFALLAATGSILAVGLAVTLPGGGAHTPTHKGDGSLGTFASIIDRWDVQPGVRALNEAPDVTALEPGQVVQVAQECAAAQTTLAGYRWGRADQQIRQVVAGFGYFAQAVRSQDDSVLAPAGRDLNAAIDTAAAVLRAK